MKKPSKRTIDPPVDTHNGIFPGDTVCLKSGGGLMVVEQLRCASMVSVVYWLADQSRSVSDGSLEWAELPWYCLKKADKPDYTTRDDDIPF
ncbi:MAG: hypothetical protein ACPG43_12555 [Alcanivoracaceae bacterium]